MQVFIDKTGPGNGYGLMEVQGTQGKLELADHIIKRFYDSIELKRAAGQKGILAIDMANPRVNVDGNMTERAETLITHYPHFVALVLTGKYVKEVKTGPVGLSVTKRQSLKASVPQMSLRPVAVWIACMLLLSLPRRVPGTAAHTHMVVDQPNISQAIYIWLKQEACTCLRIGSDMAL